MASTRRQCRFLQHFQRRRGHVFDIAQTDGDPLPEPATTTGTPGQATDCLKACIASRGTALEYVPGLAGPLGKSCNGRIHALRP